MSTPLIQISGLEKAFATKESWLGQWRFHRGKFKKHQEDALAEKMA